MSNIINQGILNIFNRVAPNLTPVIEVSLDLIPYASNFYNRIKSNRFERRIEENLIHLKKISQLYADTTLSAEFISEKVSPIVFGDIIEEYEDSKINLILTGFENIFIEENSKESVIISYFDTLRTLRYIDIKRLLYFAGKSEYEMPEKGSEEHAILENSDKKLMSLGLIYKKEGGISFGVIYPEEKTITTFNRNNIRISKYADNFVNFITSNTVFDNEIE